ncbi:unnamed protein product [Linum tenue]|uniref:Uncharacterized protein n=1 Tax=Linum tenue TaxID=586396 RepID=A0AAV0MEW3_9ROSI|nr:unnamed protein product [Linum tenue]
MSRCLPFPPPGYVWHGVEGEALIQLLIKTRDEKQKQREKRRRKRKQHEWKKRRLSVVIDPLDDCSDNGNYVKMKKKISSQCFN